MNTHIALINLLNQHYFKYNLIILYLINKFFNKKNYKPLIVFMLIIYYFNYFIQQKTVVYATPSPKAIDLLTASKLDEFESNYCNSSGLILKAGLLRAPLGQFLGFPCSNEFFHCRWQSDGYRTYKKNCRSGK